MGWWSIFKRKPVVLDKWEEADAQADPVAGEWWVMNDDPNPFAKTRHLVKILDVKEGWVQYDRGGSGPFKIDSRTMKSFKWIYKRVEPMTTKALDADQPA